MTGPFLFVLTVVVVLEVELVACVALIIAGERVFVVTAKVDVEFVTIVDKDVLPSLNPFVWMVSTRTATMCNFPRGKK